MQATAQDATLARLEIAKRLDELIKNEEKVGVRKKRLTIPQRQKARSLREKRRRKSIIARTTKRAKARIEYFRAKRTTN